MLHESQLGHPILCCAPHNCNSRGGSWASSHRQWSKGPPASAWDLRRPLVGVHARSLLMCALIHMPTCALLRMPPGMASCVMGLTLTPR